MLVKDYVDKKGIKRRVLVPDESTPPEQGIPQSVDFDEELQSKGNSPEFVKRLYNELAARGLITPSDFLKADSPMLIRSALLSTIQVDAQILQTIAKEQLQNANSDSKYNQRRAIR